MRLLTTTQTDQRRSRRRGAALVLVLIFAVGALALVSTMLSLSNASAKVEGSRQRDAALHFVARYGIACALTEINRKRSGLPNGDSSAYTDPTGNGFGCILVDPVDGLPGYAVYTNDGGNKRLLGRFKTKVNSLVTPKILSVVAVDGPFPPDATAAQTAFNEGRLRYITAEVEIVVARIAFDRNAISVRGDAMAGSGTGIMITSSNGKAGQVHINGNGVPAVNISDPAAHAAFQADLTGWGTFAGLDPATNTQTSTSANDFATRNKTLTQEDAGLLSQETLDKIATGINDRVAAVIASGTQITASTGTYGTPSVPGLFYINSVLDIPNSGNLTGYGTLVINKGLTVTGDLNWTGDVIVANSDNALVYVKGTVNVDGILAVQGMGPAVSMGINIKGRVNVGTVTNPGAFTMLGGVNTQQPISFESGSQGAKVYGIMSIMGNNMTMDFDTGAKMDVIGSLAFVTPENAANGLTVGFRNGAQMTADFSAPNFDGALTELSVFYDPNQTILPVSSTTYVEDPARRDLLLDEHIATTSGDHGAN